MSGAEEEATLSKVEGEIQSLKDELSICKEAKNLGETCKDLVDYCEKEGEPFTAGDAGNPNSWHSNPGKGGGCIIL